jgi:aminocarboxymuconate-semialdehyde decarboxylase
MTVIDVHTHMMPLAYIEALREHGGEKYTVKKTPAGQDTIHLWGAPFTTLFPGMWDYDLRIQAMDEARVDVAIVSLTCPSVYWGSQETSLGGAQLVNDSMAEQQRARPDRIRWFASLPWQHADAALAELERATRAGAVGVMVLANIAGQDLTDPAFAPIWKAIEQRGLPVLVHPTAPQGLQDMHLDEWGLVPPIGFMFDTTLAFSRMILSGFLDTYPGLKLIASHGGGTLPYLAGRLDRCHEKIPACATAIKDKPSSYLQRLYYDTVVYDPAALELCLRTAGSADQLLFGSDYPHNIGDMVGCRARVSALPQKTARKILNGNAQRIFGL